jgi:hypothetical protein
MSIVIFLKEVTADRKLTNTIRSIIRVISDINIEIYSDKVSVLIKKRFYEYQPYRHLKKASLFL